MKQFQFSQLIECASQSFPVCGVSFTVNAFSRAIWLFKGRLSVIEHRAAICDVRKSVKEMRQHRGRAAVLNFFDGKNVKPIFRQVTDDEEVGASSFLFRLSERKPGQDERENENQGKSFLDVHRDQTIREASLGQLRRNR